MTSSKVTKKELMATNETLVAACRDAATFLSVDLSALAEVIRADPSRRDRLDEVVRSLRSAISQAATKEKSPGDPEDLCGHPKGRIYYGVAWDDTVKTGQVLWGACCDCGELVYTKPLPRAKPVESEKSAEART